MRTGFAVADPSGDIEGQRLKMRRVHITIFLPAMLSCLLYSAGTAAQSTHAKEKLTLTPERWSVNSWDWTGY